VPSPRPCHARSSIAQPVLHTRIRVITVLGGLFNVSRLRSSRRLKVRYPEGRADRCRQQKKHAERRSQLQEEVQRSVPRHPLARSTVHVSVLLPSILPASLADEGIALLATESE
jgi:hypothetical protein